MLWKRGKTFSLLGKTILKRIKKVGDKNEKRNQKKEKKTSS